MKKYVPLLLTGTLLAAAAPAAAQDANPTFTGLRVEALAGYGQTGAGSTADDPVNDDNDQDIEGLTYGGAVGFDFAMGGVLVGAEAEYTDSGAKTETNAGDFEGFGLGRVEQGRDLYVGGRVGVLATPSTLVYAKGGYTNARFDVLASDGTTELDTNFDADGWRAGAGIEQAFGSNTYAKLEYRYSNYEEAEVNFANGTTSQDFNVDLDRHQVMAGVGIRF